MAEKDKGEKKEKKSSKKLILILLVLMLLGGGGAFGYIKFFKAKKAGNAETKKAVEVAPKGSSEKLTAMPLNPYLVNLIDPDTRRYLKVRIVLNLSEKKVEKEITEKLPSISDSIIMYLTSKTYDEVISPMGKKKLKSEIQKIVNKHLQTGRVNQVFFTEFLVQ
ncbi:MAG TPA: flagellar basal body-associated FliL family protein [Deltaproteobacteria bacterium]|nr:MAG: flagellar basal body protein FliL [Deltaproteobacteria bacterium]HDM77272.1 flagellar basal body-associated FliL family protein [Deltaproteobacteria bacterium]